MEFWVLEVSHKRCPIEIRERIHFSGSALDQALGGIRFLSGIAEGAMLSTCNRVECMLVTGEEGGVCAREAFFSLIENVHGIPRETFASFVEAYEGKAAIRHVMRVAAGLESLVLGEDEILGQMREALRRAHEAGTTGKYLHRLIEKSLKAGKEVRHRTKINRGATSVPSAAVELTRKMYGRLREERVMVLGTGPMGHLALGHLRKAGAKIAYVVSRRAPEGKKLAAEFQARWVAFDQWESRMADVDILITATGCPLTVISREAVARVMERRTGRPLFMIDIAVPRDIEPSAASLPDVYLYNVDDLKGVASGNLRLREKEIHAAEALVEEAAGKFVQWVAGSSAFRPPVLTAEKSGGGISRAVFSVSEAG